MLKNILLSGLLCTLLSAQGFEEFLDTAVNNSPYLKSSALALTQAKEEGSALTRYANPSLELEYSQFDPKTGDKDNGYRVNYSQPIRLWSVGNDKDALANSMAQGANAMYSRDKAVFIRDLSLLFSSYSKQKMLLLLGDEELDIAKYIYDITKERYNSGTVSRGVMLQAKVAYEMIEIRNETLVLASNQSYFNLLKFAGINKEIDLEAKYSFEVKSTQNIYNPNLEVLKIEQQKALNEASVNSNAVEWMNVFAEYENEPNQDILRAGINFPLAIFNDKSQEQTISKLQASRTELILENESSRLDMDMLRLQNERESLEVLQTKNETILSTEDELLKMFEEGYKIANIKLLELQDVKNKVIETKESLIQIKIALDKNAIYTNYNQGTYND